MFAGGNLSSLGMTSILGKTTVSPHGAYTIHYTAGARSLDCTQRVDAVFSAAARRNRAPAGYTMQPVLRDSRCSDKGAGMRADVIGRMQYVLIQT